MVNFFKKSVLAISIGLLLIPALGFQQTASEEFTVAAAENEDSPDTAVNDGTSYNQEEAAQPSEEEKQQLSREKAAEKQEPQPDTRDQSGKKAYLTFDDGPSPLITPEILEILRENDIKATFFVIGNMAEKNPELIHQIQEEGHLICNHTYSHNYKLIYSNPDNFMADVKKWETVLRSILGEDFETNILRFPAGSFGKKRQSFRERVKAEGYINVDWNVLNGDAEALHVPADVLVGRIKETIKNRDNAIVLMHDSNTKDTTAEALPEIINYLKSEGYSFETLEGYATENSEVGK